MKMIGFNPFRAGRSVSQTRGRATPFSGTTDELPEAVDVVIVGGGIAGLSAAIELRSAGLTVLVCEKGWVGAEQTSRALGWVASLGDEPARFELSHASKSLWREFGRRAGDRKGGFQAVGLTLSCQTEDEVDHFEAWISQNQGRTDARIIAGNDLEERFGGSAPADVRFAAFQPSDGAVEPEHVAAMLAGIAVDAGARILQQCAVRGIERSGGAISAVVTERGTVKAQALIVAAGAWSRRLCASIDIDVPTLLLHSTLAITTPVSGGPRGCGAFSSGGWRSNPDGSFVIGRNTAIAPATLDSFRLLRHFLPSLRHAGDAVAIDVDREFVDSFFTPRHWRTDTQSMFERDRVVGSQPDPTGSDEILQDFARAIQGFSEARLAECWGGIVDATPDRTPIVSDVPSRTGLYLCTGFSAHGLAMAPAAGKLVAELVAGLPPSVPPRPYHLNRF